MPPESTCASLPLLSPLFDNEAVAFINRARKQYSIHVSFITKYHKFQDAYRHNCKGLGRYHLGEQLFQGPSRMVSRSAHSIVPVACSINQSTSKFPIRCFPHLKAYALVEAGISEQFLGGYFGNPQPHKKLSPSRKHPSKHPTANRIWYHLSRDAGGRMEHSSFGHPGGRNLARCERQVSGLLSNWT